MEARLVPKVIIVDSFSNDQTLEIARRFRMFSGPRVFDTHAMSGIPS